MPHVSSVHDVEHAEAIARTIGRRVREGRTGRGWTLDVLAQRSGVSRRMLVNVEQGVTNPSIATLLRLADAFRASVIDANTEHFIFEITGKGSKVDQFIAIMKPLGLVEICRTGVAAMNRGPQGM